MRQIAAQIFRYLRNACIAVIIVATAALSWLRWESHQPRDEWFEARRGKIENVYVDNGEAVDQQLSSFVTLRTIWIMFGTTSLLLSDIGLYLSLFSKSSSSSSFGDFFGELSSSKCLGGGLCIV